MSERLTGGVGKKVGLLVVVVALVGLFCADVAEAVRPNARRVPRPRPDNRTNALKRAAQRTGAVALPNVSALAREGITCQDAPNGGALVTGVRPGSNAAQAGLEVGDVIISIEGIPVAGCDQLDTLLSVAMSLGFQRVTLGVIDVRTNGLVFVPMNL